MKLKKVILSTVLGFALFGTTIGVHAQDQQTPAKYPAYESNGLYDAGHPNNLGAGIFHKTKRSELTKLINAAPKSGWIALDALMTSALLTTTELSTLQNDITNQQGNDLFTTRINKLLEWGHHKKAYALYSTVKENVTSEETAKAGVLTMLYNGQRGKACLEVKISLPNYPDNVFWREMNAYCTISHSDDENADQWAVINRSKSKIMATLLQDKNYKIPYSKSVMSAYSQTDRAIIAAQKAIDISGMEFSTYNDIAPEHLEILLLNPGLSDENRIILSGYAAQNGIVDAADLQTLYTETIAKHDKALRSGPLAILMLYDDAKDALLGSTRIKNIDKAFSLANTYGDGILIPLVPSIAKIDADDLSLEQIERSIRLFITTNSNPPDNWLEDLTDINPENEADKNTLAKLILATQTLSESVDKNVAEASQNIINAYVLSNANASGINYIIENIDSVENNSDKVFNIYENGFDLTARNSYTMPPPVIINELKRSSKNQNIAQTLLLAGITSNKNVTQNIYLKVLEHTVNALVQIGFKRQAKQILAQAILEID